MVQHLSLFRHGGAWRLLAEGEDRRWQRCRPGEVERLVAIPRPAEWAVARQRDVARAKLRPIAQALHAGEIVDQTHLLRLFYAVDISSRLSLKP